MQRKGARRVDMKKFNLFCNIVLLVLVIIVCILLKVLNFISFVDLTIIFGIIAIIVLVFGYIHIKLKLTKMYVFFNILSVLLIIIFGVISIFLIKTYYFVIQSRAFNVEVHNYYLLSLKDTNITDYKSVDGKVGTAISVPEFIENDMMADFENYDNQEILSLVLFNHSVQAILVDNICYTIMQEVITDFDDKIKVLKVFEETVAIKTVNNGVNDGTSPFVLYLSGIDTYGNIETTSRSDVNILIVVNPKTYKVLLLFIPRDYYVEIPNTNGYKDKLTHTGIYGIDTSIQTIENLLDIEINYYLRVNFNTVIELIDAIGGVDIYSDLEFVTSNDKRCYMKEGLNHVNGRCALSFSRERFAYQDGDRHRGRNQQEVIKGVISVMTTKEDLLTNYLSILDNLDGKFQTNFDLNNLGYYVQNQIKNKASWEVEMISLNGFDSFNYTYSSPHQELYVMEPDWNTINMAQVAINKILQNNN